MDYVYRPLYPQIKKEESKLENSFLKIHKLTTERRLNDLERKVQQLMNKNNKTRKIKTL